jgi:hypothetical protein
MANSLVAALLADGNVLLVGGRVIQPNAACYYGVPSVSVSTAILFDSSSGTFLDISDMNYSPVGHTTTPLNGAKSLSRKAARSTSSLATGVLPAI